MNLKRTFEKIMNTVNISDEEVERIPQKRSSLKQILRLAKQPRVLIVLFLIIMAGVGGYLYLHRETPQEKSAREVAAAVSGIEKHMLVPAGTPVLATVQDSKTLKAQQPFFANAQDGDQLLMFPESRQAVLYSPARGIIVNVGPIQYQDNAPATNKNPAVSVISSTSTKNSLPITVEVRNGSGKNGYGASVAQRISSDISYSVINITDAKSKNYTNNVVVDIGKNSNQQEAVQVLAKKINATVISKLPNGESATNADVVVIIGSEVTP